MTWWQRWRGRGARRTESDSGSGRGRRRTDGPGMDVDYAAVRRHAQEFVGTRRGVEGYVEPATNISTTTLVLVAHDGEWTRRAVGDPRAGFQLCRDLEIPVYDVNQIGYPNRMREWSRRQREGS